MTDHHPPAHPRRAASWATSALLAIAPLTQASAALPAEIDLRDLLAAFGGDGSVGTVIFGPDDLGVLGDAVALVGDLNGDGIDDVVTASSAASEFFQPAAGEAYVIFGRADGFPSTLVVESLSPTGGGDGSDGFVVAGLRNSDAAGRELAGIGDVNGDGINDLLVSAPLATVGDEAFAGEGYVIFGRTDGFPALIPVTSLFPGGGGDGSAGFVVSGAGLNDALLGNAVSAAGDLNGDGIDDFAMAATSATSGGRESAGEVYVIYGRDDGFPPILRAPLLREAAGGDGSQGFVIRGVSPGDNIASALSPAGDFNGDGIDDLLIGANEGGDVPNGPGQAYLIFGNADGFAPTLDLRSLLPAQGGDGSVGVIINSVENDDLLGEGVGAADLNGDGLTDLMLGAPDGDGEHGVVYVLYGTPDNLGPVFELADLLAANGGDGTQGYVLFGADFQEQTGSTVANAGDINHDGIDDMLIGADFGPANGIVGAGRTYLVYGQAETAATEFELASLLSANGGDGSLGVVFNGINTQDRSGFRVSAAGDVNADGIDDVFIGSRPLFESRGAAYIVLGQDAN